MPPKNTKDHPVWSLYDEMRTARLNVKCLQAELRILGRASYFAEVVIALSAASSIGGFWFMQNFAGGYIWKSVGALAVVCSALKPVFRLPDKIRKKQELLASYRILDHDLYCISIDVKEQHQYDKSMQADFHKALKRKAELVKKSDDSSVSDKLLRECQAQANQELPLDSFFIPD